MVHLRWLLTNLTHFLTQQAPIAAFHIKPIVTLYSTQTRSLHHTIMSAARKKKEDFPPVPHVTGTNLIPRWMNKERTKVITVPDVLQPKTGGTCVYYWMQRDMRTEDNWALLYANYLAEEQKVPLKVLYVLPPPVPSDEDNEEGMPPKVCQMKMVRGFAQQIQILFFFLGNMHSCIRSLVVFSISPGHRLRDMVRFYLED